MTESIDDGEFWLPPSFLTDDEDTSAHNNNNATKKARFDMESEGTKSFSSPFEFSSGFGGHFSSDLSSPVESVVGSTETESDEEDIIAGLSRQMSRSFIEDGFLTNDFFSFLSEKPKGLPPSGSPQSTLCPVGRGCGCRQSSSRGSPNCQSQVSSPPGTWDLLYAAAGEVARMRQNEESFGFNHQNRGPLYPPRKPVPVKINSSFDVGYYSHNINNNNQSIAHQKLQAAQFQHLKQQQLMKQQQQQQASSVWGGVAGPQTKGTGLYQVGLNNRGRSNNGSSSRPLNLSPSAWPPLQQAVTTPHHQNGSGMRAMFLGAPGVKRECAGTGVFLPRRTNTTTSTEPRKKPGCSTVLLPAKVVQALNLNFDEMGVPLQPRFGSYSPDTDAAAAALRFGNNNNVQRNNVMRPQPVMNHHEVRLPPEWTY